MFITLYIIIFKKTAQINSATVKESHNLREITSVLCYFYACPGILQSGWVRIGVSVGEGRGRSLQVGPRIKLPGYYLWSL